MIDGVVTTPLKQIVDERGSVLQMLRSDSAVFEQFGEIYFSTVHAGAMKAWRLHREMTLNYAVPYGKIKLVLFDDRDGSPTRGQIQEFFVGPENYILVTIPPLVWNGFKGIGDFTSIVANCGTIPHDPEEVDRRDPFDPAIGYDWGIKHG